MPLPLPACSVSGVDDTPRAGVVLGGGGGGAVSREALARVVAALLSEEEGLQADREVMVRHEIACSNTHAWSEHNGQMLLPGVASIMHAVWIRSDARTSA